MSKRGHDWVCKINVPKIRSNVYFWHLLAIQFRRTIKNRIFPVKPGWTFFQNVDFHQNFDFWLQF